MPDIKYTPGPWIAEPGGGKGAWIKSLITGEWSAMSCGNSNASADANAHLIAAAPELADVVRAFIDETVDYMTLNNLGDPEQQHNVKWARAVLTKAEGRSTE